MKNVKVLIWGLIQLIFSVVLVLILNVFLVFKIILIVQDVLRNFLWREVHVYNVKKLDVFHVFLVRQFVMLVNQEKVFLRLVVPHVRLWIVLIVV